MTQPAADTSAALSAALQAAPESKLAAVYILDGVPGFGPQKFKALYDAGLSAADVFNAPFRFPSEALVGRTAPARQATRTPLPGPTAQGEARARQHQRRE